MNVLTIYEIVGLCLTVLSTIAAYVKSSTDAKKQNAALVSLIGVMFTMLVAMRFDTLPKIERYLGMEAVLSKNKDLLPIVEKIASAQQVEGSAHPLMNYMLKERLRGLEEQFDKMTQGRFLVDQSELPGFALEMIRSAKKRVLATSYVQVLEWWATPWGKQYEQLNEQKAKDGVTITRIFIFSNKDDFRKTEELLRAEKDAGIDVRYAYASDLSSRITSDMVVIDDNLSGELRLTPDKGVTLAEFMTRPTDVSETAHRIDEVTIQSTMYDVATGSSGRRKAR